MRIVMALGGNALLRRNEKPEAETQRHNVRRAVETAVAPVARVHELVVTHGNGPQVGLLALQAAAYRAVRPYPLDVLGAESEGMIGYLIDLEIANAMPERDVATLLTSVEIDRGDPAFAAPSKPIGPVYGAAEAEQVARQTGWAMMHDSTGWRRAVPSPTPRRIREIATIKLLLRSGVIVVCTGGGGIPVAPMSGGFHGVEAVIDKDAASALLAESIEADVLLLLTDVPAVWTRWPMSDGQPIRQTTATALRAMSFAAGSMAPKVDAACRFVERSGRIAAIGAIEDAAAILAGEAGTIVQAN